MGNCCSNTAVVTRHSEALPPRPQHPTTASVPTTAVSTSGNSPSSVLLSPTDEVTKEHTPPTPTLTESEQQQQQRNRKSPLTEQELNQRTSASHEPESFVSGDYKISYAYVSLRGYYPDSINKPNQDAYVCKPTFHNECSFFGVFDGHGTTGDKCAQYARDVVPTLLQQHLTKNIETTEALTRAHVDANTMMHSAPFDDSMSGTTAISVLFQTNEIHISNVGDSRAIIAQEIASADGTPPQLVAKALSIDQTPFRKDERDRVKKTGARILTVDQLEGYEPIHENWGLTLGDEIDESGDPPRIWHPYGDYPGTAFTRSLGDHVSEELGVFAEPEIITKTLNAHDKFIVIASDGVFEFLTSQAVVNIVKEYKSPLDACHTVVMESFSRWLDFEERTDDITCIILFVEPVAKQVPVRSSKLHGRNSIIAGQDVLLAMQDCLRPVRGLDLNKNWRSRDTIIGGFDTARMSMASEELFSPAHQGSHGLLSPIADYDVKMHAVPKSPEDLARLERMVQHNFLFAHLTADKLNDVLSVMKRQVVADGDVVIRQHDDGDRFFLVDSGRFDVRVRRTPVEPEAAPSTGDSLEAMYGPVVHTYVGSEGSHPTFGELALMYSKPRAATVIATGSGTLWTIDRMAFRSILVRRPMRHIIQRLRNVSPFRALTIAQLNLVAEHMQQATFTSVRNTQTLHHWPENGLVLWRLCARRHSHVVLVFGLFNRIHILSSCSPYSAVAEEDTECLCISREAFEATLGTLSVIVEQNKVRRARKSITTLAKQSAPLRGLVVVAHTPSPALEGLVDIGQVTVGPTIWQDLVATCRLAKYNNKWVTLRSITKQTVVESHLKHQLLGEQDMYVALGRVQAGLAPLYGVTQTAHDLHAVFDVAYVGVLDEVATFPLSSEAAIRFYAAHLVVALQLLHADGILTRSLDPTHLMVTREGDVAIFGLNLSKYVGAGRTFTICGNPEYLAPEQINGQGQSLVTDYWSLGILLYEMLVGTTPFEKHNQDELAMFNGIVAFSPDSLEFPPTSSPALQSLIKMLLDPTPATRFGADDCLLKSFSDCAVPKHSFFNGLQWDQLQETKAPLLAIATAKFEQLVTALKPQPLDLGVPYTGDAKWMQEF
ncbi:AGC protein kinase [Aphanomyces invadans]|uniref:protein-serine/threonine phosphatase n=1 Tax=Aphanomyces invadans TaxID=157072 RepID=A0A024UNS7_9STRA|nr:AGC protein kinase [Aphanomyces invadans]ETW07835.1 AGC protein kinase [Aphanomyces invadans]|eukprot:XP_008863928.1 AGC protein kinase [Aphanomyces invadans]